MRKLLSLAFLSIVVLFVTSCKKDEVTPDVLPTICPTPDPNYVGVWVLTDSVGRMGVHFDANTYYMTFFVGGDLLSSSSGTTSVVGDLMTLTETEIGKLDMSNVMQTYKAGTAAYIANGGDATPDLSKFTVVADTLTLMSDNNNDKVYGGTGDDAPKVFIKIKPSIDPF